MAESVIVVEDGAPPLIVEVVGDAVREEVPEIVVVEVAEQGPPGRNGASGGSAGGGYEHTQSAPATAWTVAHNLARYPSIAVVDHLGELIYPDVRYISADIVLITFSVPTIGRVFCN